MFQKAMPIWYDMGLNTNLIFCAKAQLAGATLRISASDFYKVYIDDCFLGFGPARTAKGYARVDEYVLSSGNEIRIEVAGYGCKSLSTVKQSSFCCAEVTCGKEVLVATGGDFTCFINRERRQKTERFSMQRHFTEIYDIGEMPKYAAAVPVKAPIFIERRVPYADFSLHKADTYVGGNFIQGELRRKNAYTAGMRTDSKWGQYSEEEISDLPFRYVDSQEFRADLKGKLPVSLTEGQWIMLDACAIQAGFPFLKASAKKDSEIILAMTENCPDDAFDFVNHMHCQPVIQYNLKAGQQMQKESFEPYTFRKVAVLIKSGEITISEFGWRNFVRNMKSAKRLKFDDLALQGVYDAALRTFSHNAVDIFTDCPSRERAGWLCDSYFTGKAEYFLFGKTPVEDAFLENFILYKNEGEYPQGVLPMTYPSDPGENNKFIPQWDMWYVLEVCDYLTNRNKSADREAFRPSVMGVIEFLSRYENELGLLEKLPGWNFVEWSKANEWVQDINYPTNFLYAGMLEAVGDTFGLPLAEKVKHIRKQAIDYAFNGELFVDHAKRVGNNVVNYDDISEACQYYAVLFGDIDVNDAKYAKLKEAIINGFNFYQKENFCSVNAFIGMYLRMSVLHRMGDTRLLHNNIQSFFGGMCDKTGTLWEYKIPEKSLDHGFTSYVVTLM